MPLIHAFNIKSFSYASVLIHFNTSDYYLFNLNLVFNKESIWNPGCMLEIKLKFRKQIWNCNMEFIYCHYQCFVKMKYWHDKVLFSFVISVQFSVEILELKGSKHFQFWIIHNPVWYIFRVLTGLIITFVCEVQYQPLHCMLKILVPVFPVNQPQLFSTCSKWVCVSNLSTYSKIDCNREEVTNNFVY